MGARPAFVAPNDQPWSQPFRFWLDQARTQPLMLTGAGGRLQFPGGSTKVALEASAGGNVATLSMAQGDLAALRLGTWWGELQYAYGGFNVGSLRFDYLVANGLGTGLSAAQGSGSPLDCIVLDAAPLDIITVFAGSAAAPFLTLSTALQARLGVNNVDDALLTLLRLVSTRTTPGADDATVTVDSGLYTADGTRLPPATADASAFTADAGNLTADRS